MYKKGQALTTLLVFMAIATTITAGSVVVILTGSRSADRFAQGVTAMQIAESGGEEALMRLIRDPAYTGGSVNVGQGTAIATVSGTTVKTITITGQYGEYSRQLQITAGYAGGLIQVTPPWREVFP